MEDELTGLTYLRARYYNPATGRLTQEDVIYDDGFNLYAYCDSNPVIYCDPSGFARLKCEYKAGNKTARGREYSKHAAERANERGFDSQIIDSIIDNNYKSRVKEIDKLTGQITWRYQDKRGNTVIQCHLLKEKFYQQPQSGGQTAVNLSKMQETFWIELSFMDS